MPDNLSKRDAAIARMGDVMRDFMSSAVLFQDAVARHGGLNSTDMQTVSILISQGPATPGELAERTGLTAGGSITAVIDRLEKAGYVRRERDVADRRRVIVSAVAETVMAKVGPIYGRVGDRWAEYLRTLSEHDLELAVELFDRAGEINRDELQRLRSEGQYPSGNPPAAGS